MSVLAPKDPKESRTALLIMVVLFLTVLVLSFVTPPNPNATIAYRVFLGLFAALVAIYIPGAVGIELPNGIKVGGAIAIFVLVYLFSPGERLRAAMSPPEAQTSRRPAHRSCSRTRTT